MILLALILFIQAVDLDQVRKDFKTIKTEEQARNYLTSNKLTGDILELNEVKDSSAAALKLFKAKSGEVIEQQSSDKKITYLYKTLTSITSEADRVQYIYFNNAKVSKKSIDSLRTVVMKRLKNGDTFPALAKEYSMDPNGRNGGDLGWYDPKVMAADFVKAVRAHKKGDIFLVDVPSQKWYYVVRKSHDTIKPRQIVAVYAAVLSK